MKTGPLGQPLPDRLVREDGTVRDYTVDDLTDIEREALAEWMDDNHDRIVSAVMARL